MTTWFTSDLHFGHANVIGYSSRPFADVEEMNEALATRWNERVSPSDTVWVLGDFALGRISDTLPLVGLLNGTKILVAGNHDRCWAGHRKGSEAWTYRYLAAGFSEVRQGAVDLSVGGHHALACHFPYSGDSHDHDRYGEARPIDRGTWLLHGHVHERWRVRQRMINVGVDAWGQAPVSEAQLAALIAAGPADIGAFDPQPVHAGDPDGSSTSTDSARLGP
jgi:calcineurin-like phosphoesterase family protein